MKKPKKYSIIIIITLISMILFLILFNNCRQSIEGKNSAIDLLELVHKMEQEPILFDTNTTTFLRIDRINGILIGFENERSKIFSITKDDSIVLYYDYNFRSGDYPADTSSYRQKISEYAREFISVFTELGINSMVERGRYEGIVDSALIIFETYLYDSTYTELNRADESFYDRKSYLFVPEDVKDSDSPYYIVLLYKYDDDVSSNWFKRIESFHTVRKIRNHWYYYRSYESETNGIPISWEKYKSKLPAWKELQKQINK